MSVPLHKFLYDLTGYRIFDNKEIKPFMKKLSQAGKMDEPKKLAILTELLVRVAELEQKNEILSVQSVVSEEGKEISSPEEKTEEKKPKK